MARDDDERISWRPNEEHVARLRDGSRRWNEWRHEYPSVVPVLSGADLTGVDLAGALLANAEMGGAVLAGANLRESILFQVELYRADLSRAVLDDADMRGAKLHQATLTDASLRRCNLFRVDFIQTILDRANFAGAFLHTTAFCNVDMSRCRGLDTAIHGGPSSLDIATLLRSGNSLSSGFVSGTGVPENVIAGLRSLFIASEPERARTQSCFISYGHQDEAFARALYTRLKGQGVRVWFAPEDLRGGRKLFEQLDEAIRRHDRLILVLSKDSLHSQWVAVEVSKARTREAVENRRVLFPIRLVPYEILQSSTLIDSQTGKDVAVELREYHIPDFSGWEDSESFSAASGRLIRDLQSDQEVA